MVVVRLVVIVIVVGCGEVRVSNNPFGKRRGPSTVESLSMLAMKSMLFFVSFFFLLVVLSFLIASESEAVAPGRPSYCLSLSLLPFVAS